MPLLNETRHIDIRPSHQCETRKENIIQVLDDYGRLLHVYEITSYVLIICTFCVGIEHKLSFVSCNCEPVSVTLARAQLWPATPHNPRYAFTFNLLNWMEVLMLECQVSIKDFCHTLKFRCPFSLPKQRAVYSALIDSFEEYRYVAIILFMSRKFHLAIVNWCALASTCLWILKPKVQNLMYYGRLMCSWTFAVMDVTTCSIFTDFYDIISVIWAISVRSWIQEICVQLVPVIRYYKMCVCVVAIIIIIVFPQCT